MEVLQKSETADCITDKGDGEQAVGYILEKAKAVGFTLEKTSEAPQPHAFARAKADAVLDVAKNTLENNLSFTILPPRSDSATAFAISPWRAKQYDII